MRIFWAIAAGAAITLGCKNDTIGPAEIKVSDLVGNWTVTRLQYASNADAATSVDLIGDLGAIGTVTVNPNGTYTYLLTLAAGPDTVTGHFTIADSHVVDTPDAGTAHPIEASRKGDVVTLVDTGSSYAFAGGAGPVPATSTTEWQKAP